MTSPSLDARIDPDRLWRSLAAVSAFGGTDDGGLHRLAATADDGRARDLVVAAARSAGCAVRVDRVGNVFCRRPGTDPEAAAVLTNLPPDFAAEILMRVQPETGARIIASVEPRQAALLTAQMGARSIQND